MRVVIVYESMFGNTHTVAERIGAGFGEAAEVTVLPVEEATNEVVAAADLVVVGGPTHVHGMSSKRSRRNATEVAAKDDDLDLDPDAEGPGLRAWFKGLGKLHEVPAAAFDTRFDAPPLFTGRASRGIAHRLRHHGFRLVADPESFLVDKDNHLMDEEDDRAETWGAALAGLVERRAPIG